MHRGALQQHGQVAFAAQQRLDPVDQAQGSFFADLALQQPAGGALHQPGQAGARVFAQGLHARVRAPLRDARAKAFGPAGRQLLDQLAKLLHAVAVFVAALADGGAAQQLVKLTGHQLAVCIQLDQKGPAVGKAQGLSDPGQVIVARGQHMGLLVVQVLDAVLDVAQKFISARQRIGGVLRHQAGAGHALQGAHGGAHAQLGKLTAAHHLQELHGEFDFTYAATRELDVIGALGVTGAAALGLLANLPVQAAQGVKHVVVQVAPEHKRQHHGAQILNRTCLYRAGL